MSQAIMKKAGLTVFEKHMKNYEPADPLYEEYVDNKGKTRRRKRELPPGLSARDAKILRKVKFRAHHLDKGFKICGMRFGWTAVIGLVPVVGDLADISLNYMLVVKKARQAELPPWLVRKMLTNNAVSAGVGLIPLAGDVMLAAFKANSRNAALLEEYLRIRGEEYIKASTRRENPQEDPEVTKPGAGRATGEVIPATEGASGSGQGRGLFGVKKGKAVADAQRKT